MVYSLEQAYPILESLMAEDKLNVFAGAGISMKEPSNLPDWNGLIDGFINMVKDIDILDRDDRKDLDKLIADAQKRKLENRFNHIEIATVLKKRLLLCKELKDVDSTAYENFASWIYGILRYKKEPNDYHKSIVKTSYPFILTTNYDMLFEAAARSYIVLPSLTYKKELEIMSNIFKKRDSIIHVHGKINDNITLENLIFTKEDYNKIILKRYEGFSFALRVLFTRYSTLFLGYGANDPHLEEIFEELTEYFPLEMENEKDDVKLPQSYLVTLKQNIDSIMDAYKSRVRINLIEIDSYDDYGKLLTHLENFKPRVKETYKEEAVSEIW